MDIPVFCKPEAWVVLTTGLVLFIVIYFLNGRRGDLPLPPGPKPLPILGNIFDLPRKVVAKEYFKLHERYGASSRMLFPKTYPHTETPRRRRCLPQRTRTIHGATQLLRKRTRALGQAVVKLLK